MNAGLVDLFLFFFCGYLLIRGEAQAGRIDAQRELIINCCCMVEALNDKVSRKATDLME